MVVNSLTTRLPSHPEQTVSYRIYHDGIDDVVLVDLERSDGLGP